MEKACEPGGIPTSTEEMIKLHRGTSTMSSIGYPEATTPQAAMGLTWVPTTNGMVPTTPTSRYPALPPVLVRRPLQNIKVALENADLWRKFHRIGTEMIITKTGRRMFPALQVSVSGLDPESEYYFLLELSPVTSEIPSVDNRSRGATASGDCTGSPRPSLVHRLRFSGREWVVAGRGEAQAPASSRIYVHPDSPAPGSRWMKGFGRRADQSDSMPTECDDEDDPPKGQKKVLRRKQVISFSKVKLTNNSLDGRGHVVLTSMHKYIPRIHIVKASDYMSLSWGPEAIFSFPETEFVAVTAYQNGKITKLKIDHNPFAKGFRENGMSKSKRKLEQILSKDRDEGHSTDEEEFVRSPCLDCNNNDGSESSKRIRANSAQSTSIESGPSRSPNSSPEGSNGDNSLMLYETNENRAHSGIPRDSLPGYFPFLWASFAQQSGFQMANYDPHYYPHLLPRYPGEQYPNLAPPSVFPYHHHHPSLVLPSLWKMPLMYPTTPSFDCLTAHTSSPTSYLPQSPANFSQVPYFPSKLFHTHHETSSNLLDLSSKHA